MSAPVPAGRRPATGTAGGPGRRPAPTTRTVRPDGARTVRRLHLASFEEHLRSFGFQRVAGADEAGRGCCAGPLVAGACVLPAVTTPAVRAQLETVVDSKALSEAARERAYDVVVRHAVAWAVVVVPAAEVDARGVHVVNLEAMRRAVALLDVRPDFVLTDGFPLPGTAAPGLGMWKGDAVARCVAAASVLAKVTRDRLMHAADERWPQYGFAGHKGYNTTEHQEALELHGPCPEHRTTWANVRAVLAQDVLQPARTAGPRAA